MKTSEELKERRLNKFGNIPVEKMSGTTREYFKKWNHRKDEIITYQRSSAFKKLQLEKRKEGIIKNCQSCGRIFNFVCTFCAN